MKRRGVILPVILFVLILLALFGAMFSFRVHSDVASVQAVANRLQTRLAAEAGVEVVKSLLRVSKDDRSVWYHNPEALHRILVWAHGTDARESGTNNELKEDMAYRFSIVADEPTEFEKYIRFGITDEASKLNLNKATADQLARLLRQTTASEGDSEGGVDVPAIVDAIIDWRDSDSKPQGAATDTEGTYYLGLDRPYQIRNGKFTSVEELLLVKGVTGQILYGEDYDRNGLLTPNEDDGDESFPPDNEDGVLNQGLYPYLTVFSYVDKTTSENGNKVYLFSDEGKLKKDLATVFPDDKDKIDFIVAVTRRGSGGDSPKGPKSPTGGQDGKNPDGESPGVPGQPGAQPGGPKPPPPPVRPGSAGPKQPKPIKKDSASSKLQAQNPGGNTGGGGDARPKNSQQPGGTPPVGGVQQGEQNSQGDVDEGVSPDREEGEKNPKGEEGSGDESEGNAPIRSPAGLLKPRRIGPTEVPSPFSKEDLPFLMDHLTTEEPSQEKKTIGLININTASRQVLKCLDGLTDEQIDAIIAARDGIDKETAASPAWVVTEGIIEDAEAFDKVAAYLTGEGRQFTIESLGYADHIGMMTRLQVVVDMIGPIPQTLYYRDLSYLGGSFPIREEDKEQIRGR